MQGLPTVADFPRNLGTNGPHNSVEGMEAGDQFLSEVFNASLTCVSKKDPYLELERISGAAEVGQAYEVLQNDVRPTDVESRPWKLTTSVSY